MTPEQEYAKRTRLAELNSKIAAAKQWGAAISVMHEERSYIEEALRDLDERRNAAVGQGI